MDMNMNRNCGGESMRNMTCSMEDDVERRNRMTCERDNRRDGMTCERDSRRDGMMCERDNRRDGMICERDNRTDCRSHMTDSSNLGDMALAMGYIPWHQFNTTYEPAKALRAGTIFPELDKPFLCRKGARR